MDWRKQKKNTIKKKKKNGWKDVFFARTEFIKKSTTRKNGK